jgi:hypothetical protein
MLKGEPMSQNIFSTEELLAIKREPRPEGVIIAEIVEGMWLDEQQAELTGDWMEIAAGKHHERAEAYNEVLKAIYERFGYAPQVWEGAVLCR